MAIVSWKIALITVSKVPWNRENCGGRKTNYNHWIIQVKGNKVLCQVRGSRNRRKGQVGDTLQIQSFLDLVINCTGEEEKESEERV